MNCIGLDHLSQVCGGAGPVKREPQQSTYAQCVDRITSEEQARLPSTKPWWNPFGSDTNSAPRATSTLDRIRAECGKPPA